MISHRIPRSLATAVLVVLALTLLAGRASAQTPMTGTVVDPAGKPVANQAVTLHEVTQASGSMVDSTTTDAGGRFTVRVPAAADTSAIFFVTTRWKGDLYMGTPFRPPLPTGTTYSVTVGVNPVQMGPVGGGMQGGGAAAGGAGDAQVPPGSSSGATRWFLVAMLALVALGAVVYALLGAARERAEERRREMLLRIAELDERAAALPGEQAAELRRERAELLAQLSGD